MPQHTKDKFEPASKDPSASGSVPDPEAKLIHFKYKFYFWYIREFGVYLVDNFTFSV